MNALDLDDTTSCPVAVECGVCGAPDDLAVATAETPVGVLCVTLCGPCADVGTLPALPSWSAAVLAVGDHCEHLGVDVDEAADARKDEEVHGRG